MGDEILSKAQEILKTADLQLKSIEVKKDIPYDLDLGNLLVIDTNELDADKFKKSEEVNEEYIKSIARDGTQFLLNAIWDLPSQTMDNMIYAILPESVTRLPREKAAPKPKPLTKWEEFAKQKGIQKKKKGTKVWDDILKEWIPRYGYKKADAERKKNWMMEVPNNADPYEDQFAKASEAKKERVARNEYLRLKNIARAKNIKVPEVGVTSTNIKSKSELETALMQTRVSTASLGKFQQTLPKEKDLPEERKRGKKRKLPMNDTSLAGIQQDNSKSLEILNKMKKKDLDYEMAVNKQIKMENIEMSHAGKKKITSGRRSKHGGRKRGKSEHKSMSKVLKPKSAAAKKPNKSGPRSKGVRAKGGANKNGRKRRGKK